MSPTRLSAVAPYHLGADADTSEFLQKVSPTELMCDDCFIVNRNGVSSRFRRSPRPCSRAPEIVNYKAAPRPSAVAWLPRHSEQEFGASLMSPMGQSQTKFDVCVTSASPCPTLSLTLMGSRPRGLSPTSPFIPQKQTFAGSIGIADRVFPTFKCLTLDQSVSELIWIGVI